MRLLPGELDYPTRLAYAAVIREGFVARQGRGESPYMSDSADGIAWSYGYRWAVQRGTPPDKGKAPSDRPRDVLAAAPPQSYGPRPRLLYRVDDIERVAIGRRGEPLERLIAEIATVYPGALMLVADASPVLADYSAGWSKAGDAAKAMGIRKSAFLSKAMDPEAVERSMVMDNDLMRRMWQQETEWLPKEPERERTMPLSSETVFYRLAGHGIGKMLRTGKYTTRGKPKLRPIGRELSFRGAQLRIYPHICLRWTERQLIGLPVAGDWGSRECTSGNLKPRLQAHSVEGVLTLYGEEAKRHCELHPSIT